MATWPATLPPVGEIGAQISAQDSVSRSKMDAGPSSRRNRFTAVARPVSYTMKLRSDQVATLETFYYDTLRNGSLAFDWINPLNDAAVSIAFTAPIDYTGIVGSDDIGERLWGVSLSLEIQP